MLIDMYNIVALCLIGILLIPLMYVYALPGNAELVLDNISIEPLYPKKGDYVIITADVYNAGFLNTASVTSLITAAYFVDGKLLYVDEIGNIEPGIANKLKISSPPVWESELGDHKIKVVLDYHNTLNDQYDSPDDNVMEKTFFIEPLKPTTLSLDISTVYVISGQEMPKITVSLTESDTDLPLIDEEVILDLDDNLLHLTTNKNGKISFSDTITSTGPVKIEAYFEGNSMYLPSDSSSYIYSIPKETAPSLIVTISDPQTQYNFEDYMFDVLIFQDSYDNLIKKIQPDSTILLDSKTFLLSLPTEHDYFIEVYLDGRFIFVTDKGTLKETSMLINEIKIPERAMIKFKLINNENQLVPEASIKTWMYSTSVQNGITDWIKVLPTFIESEPYVAEVSLSDQKTITSDPFVVFSGEQKIIPILISENDTISEIPYWIKNNAEWWATGQIDDNSFVQGIQYLIKEGIMTITPTSQGSSSGSNEIPDWIKSSAEWWADDKISDSSFVNGIQFLIKEEIIKIASIN